jgi:hypothetical protein
MYIYKRRANHDTLNIQLIIRYKTSENYSFKVFAFKINNCTFASPLMGMECLIKIILWTH